MKRITWWPQLWLGLTFNWAVLVAYAAKTGELSAPLLILYAGLIFWTVGYDTIYACQDIEDDMKIGVKSTARKFGKHIKRGVAICYTACLLLVGCAIGLELAALFQPRPEGASYIFNESIHQMMWFAGFFSTILVFGYFLYSQVYDLKVDDSSNALAQFKSNIYAAGALIVLLSFSGYYMTQIIAMMQSKGIL